MVSFLCLGKLPVRNYIIVFLSGPKKNVTTILNFEFFWLLDSIKKTGAR